MIVPSQENRNIFESAFKELLSKGIFFCLNGILLIVLFPLNRTSILINATIILMACFFYYKARKNNQRRKLRYAISIFLLFCSISYSILWPFSIDEKSKLYVYDNGQLCTFNDTYRKIDIAGEKVNVFVIGDVIRRTIFFWFPSMFSDDIQLIEEKEINSEKFLVIPLRYQSINTIKSAISSNAEKTCYVPNNIVGLKIDFVPPRLNGNYLPIKRYSPDSVGLTNFFEYGLGMHIAMGPIGAPFIYSNYANVNNSVRWNYVRIEHDAEISDVEYVSVLDNAVMCVVRGDAQGAITQFDYCNHMAPSSTENIRCQLLLNKLIGTLFRGNVGTLQSLSLYNKTYEMFIKQWRDCRESSPQEGNHLINWMCRELYEYYYDFGRIFNAKMSTVLQVAEAENLLPIDTVRNGYIFDVIDSIKRMSYLEFKSKCEEVSKQNLQESLLFVNLSCATLSLAIVYDSTALSADEVLSSFDALGLIVEGYPKELKNSYWSIINLRKDLFRASLPLTDPEMKQFLISLGFIRMGMPKTALLFGGEPIESLDLLAVSSADYEWTECYFWDDFACKASDILYHYSLGDSLTYQSIDGLIDIRRFARDRDGNVFYPSIALLTLFTEHTRSLESRRLKNELFDVFKVDHMTLLNPPSNTADSSRFFRQKLLQLYN